MFEFIVTLVMCVVAGFVVGVGVLVVQENPKLGTFLKTRPVIGWTLAFLAGGLTISVLLILLEMGALAVIGLVLK